MTTSLAFDYSDIAKLLPHKHPFLFVDQAYDIVPAVKGSGRKNYTINEWYFQGHFPGEPIVPGVLLVESLAQLTALVYVAEAYVALKSAATGGQMEPQAMAEISQMVGYLVKVDAKFLQPVRPGECLEMSVTITKKLQSLSKVLVQGRVGRTPVVNGELTVSRRANKKLFPEAGGLT